MLLRVIGSEVLLFFGILYLFISNKITRCSSKARDETYSLVQNDKKNIPSPTKGSLDCKRRRTPMHAKLINLRSAGGAAGRLPQELRLEFIWLWLRGMSRLVKDRAGVQAES